MANALFLVLLLIGAGALAINRVALWGWAAAAVLLGFAAYGITNGDLYVLPAMTIVAGILFAALATVGGLLKLTGLPLFGHPLFKVGDFRRATSDGFFLFAVPLHKSVGIRSSLSLEGGEEPAISDGHKRYSIRP